MVGCLCLGKKVSSYLENLFIHANIPIIAIAISIAIIIYVLCKTYFGLREARTSTKLWFAHPHQIFPFLILSRVRVLWMI